MEIFNVKVRTRLLHDKVGASGAIANHDKVMTSLFKGLDNEDSDVIDNASRHVHSILRSVLNSSVKGWKLLDMLQKMNKGNYKDH
jgi:hypothetical protein